MPSLGEIYYFESQEVIGYDTRNKYHILITLRGGRFLFINSNPYDGCMEINREDWPEMPKKVSYIGLSSLLTYPTEYISEQIKLKKLKPSGRLTNECILKLKTHVESSETLPFEEIELIVKEINDYFDLTP